jgi:hypothetical protein
MTLRPFRDEPQDWCYREALLPQLLPRQQKPALALPLGPVPTNYNQTRKIGAGDEIRTHDFNLGKVALYP